MCSQPNWMWSSLAPTWFHCPASALKAKKRTSAAKIHCATRKILRRDTAKNLSVDVGVAARRGLGRERRKRVDASRFAKIRSPPVAREQIVEGAGQGAAVTGGDKQASLLMLNHISEPTGVERYDGRFTQQCFDCYEPKAFVRRRNDNCCRPAVHRGKLGLRKLPMPPHAIGDSELASHSLERGAIGSFAHYVELSAEFHAAHCLQ